MDSSMSAQTYILLFRVLPTATDGCDSNDQGSTTTESRFHIPPSQPSVGTRLSAGGFANFGVTILNAGLFECDVELSRRHIGVARHWCAPSYVGHNVASRQPEMTI